LSLQNDGKPLASQRWMQLLARIDDMQSISAAAKAVGLSYKAAWDAVEAMNNLASHALVKRSTGGKGGGGTVLTDAGRQLVATYQFVEVENQRFLDRLNARINNGIGNLQLIRRVTMLTSARNHFAGTVTRLKRGAVNDEVQLTLAGGERIVSVVTRESVKTLNLRLGAEAIALVKASWIILVKGGQEAAKLSARNRLTGIIKRLNLGAVNVEVIIELKGGNTLVAVVTKESVKELELNEGQTVDAIFKASSVILGVAA
jgi:molybdate transport system regulatory protein